MMHLHKVVEALRGIEGAPKLAIPNIPHHLRPDFLAWMSAKAQGLAQAQCFLFENVPVNPDGEGGMDLPGCDPEDLLLYQQGYLPAPFPLCWFEIAGAEHGETLCFLLQELDEQRLKIIPMRFLKINQEEIVQFTGEEWVVHRTEGPKPSIEVFDPFMGAAIWYSLNNISQEVAIKGETGLVMYLLMMLVSKTSEISTVEAPAKLNKARRKRDKPVIPAHRVVSIIPRNIARAMRADGLGHDGSGEGRVRASPRLHWRRSHLRHVGEKIIVIARQLIGYKALDGRDFVPHEYRVKL